MRTLIYFHITTTNKRHKNRIMGLDNIVVNRTYDPTIIKDTIINPIKYIYTTDLINSERTNPTTCKNVISVEYRTSMGRPLEKDEIKKSI